MSHKKFHQNLSAILWQWMQLAQQVHQQHSEATPLLFTYQSPINFFFYVNLLFRHHPKSDNQLTSHFLFPLTHQFKHLKIQVMKPVEVRLVGRFRLSGKVQGQHQHILYEAVHTQTDAALFLKGEEIKSRPQAGFLSILQEGKILQTMQGGIGIPHMHWCGQEEDYNFIVLEWLQCSLLKLFTRCSNKFSLKSVLMFGQQAISILQYYHFKNFVHNHLNPKHFMIGSGQKYGKLYLVDYSNSIRYRDAQTLQHIAQTPSDRKVQPRLINMEFSSLRYHKGVTPSRKDDIISLLYLMLYFLKGELPWSHIMQAKKSQPEKSKAILDLKQKLSPEQVFQGYSDLSLLYEYTQSLAFDEKPRYTYYKNIFTQRLQKEGLIDDKIYDWYLLQDEEEDGMELDMNFDVIPNEEEFIKQLSEEIKVRQKNQAEGEGSKSQNMAQLAQGKKAKKKNQKDCLIY